MVGAGSALTLAGNYSQSAAASLSVELGGPPTSVNYSQIGASGSATLGGTLHIAITNGYIPNAGDRFQVMSFNGESGTFTSVTGLSAGRTQVLAIAVNPTNIVINSIINSVDLDTGAITSPTSGVAGQDVTISYTVTNNAANATFSNAWVDSVYLTQGTTLDPFAKLIGRVQHVGAVAEHSSYAETLTAPLPAVIPGVYQVIVLSDSEGFVPETNRANNSAVASTPISVDIPTLTPGVTFSGTIANGQHAYFRVVLPAGPCPRSRPASPPRTAARSTSVFRTCRTRQPTISSRSTRPTRSNRWS
jgi:hypothetical protein